MARQKTAEASDKALPTGADDRLFVGSIGKCFRVIEALGTSNGPLSLGELAERTELDKSSAQRIVHTLRVLGYIRQHPESRGHLLSSKFLRLGHAMLRLDRLREVAHPHLQALNRRCRETVNLLEQEGNEIVFMTRFPSFHVVSVDLKIGARLPLYRTAPGRAILAHLPEEEALRLLKSSRRERVTRYTTTDLDKLIGELEAIRRRGYALNNQEAFLGDVSVAAPLFEVDGSVAGAINIAVASPRWPLDEVRRQLAPMVMVTAQQINDALSAN